MKYTEIKSSTGSELGSYHWFMTLLARHKHMGEFLKDGNHPAQHILDGWAVDLYNTSDELISWFHNYEIDKITYMSKIKSIFSEIAEKVFVMTKIDEAREFIIKFVQDRGINEKDKLAIIHNVCASKTIYQLQKYICNSLLKYEGMSVSLI